MVSVAMASDLLWSLGGRADSFPCLVASAIAQRVVPHTYLEMCLLFTAMLKCIGLLKAHQTVNIYNVRLGSGIASSMQTPIQSTLAY